jgi:predicted transport protein
LNIEEVYKRTTTVTTSNRETDDFNGKNPIMVEAGKKAALTRKTATYTLEEHFEGLNEEMKELFQNIRDFITGLDNSIEEAPKKKYVAYKTSQNFACLQATKNKIVIYLKLDADQLKTIPKQGRDVKDIGHFGTGDFELTIKSIDDFDETKYLINEAYKNIGG